MVQAKPRFATFEEYIAHSDATGLEEFYELIDGELVPLPPKSEPNPAIANFLLVMLTNSGIWLRLIQPGKCELQVPVLQPKDPANRFPDLLVLREDHIPLLKKRATITLDMPPPQLVVEVVSPGQANRDRDYLRKRDQYAARDIPEYWIIDPDAQTVTVLQLKDHAYTEVGIFQDSALIISPTFPNLTLTPAQIFSI